MKRTVHVGVCLFLVLAFTLPALAQSGENAEWQAIEDQRDARRKAELLDKFIKDRSSSAHRPDADLMLLDYYASNKDWAKIMAHADGFRQNLPTADAASKSKVYTQAMVAAATLNNIAKTVEFGGYALQAEPNNLTVLSFFAQSNLPDATKAQEYAAKALTVPRPATMPEDKYNATIGRMHAVVAPPLITQQKFAEAQEHLSIALKANPKDHQSQYLTGFVNAALAGLSARAAQDANDALIKAQLEKPVNQANVDAAKAKVDAASKEALQHRDDAVDSFARAVAIGGPLTEQAKTLLDNVYKNKNNGSLDGEDQLIADKKKELGL